MRRPISRRRRKRVAIQEISLTPLIDTALTLLIIFMVATPMMQNAIRITLPKGAAKETNSVKEDLTVYIDAQGKLFFDGKEMPSDQIIAEIKNQVAQDQEKTVFVKGDKSGPYGPVMEFVDKVKVVGGVKYVALATQKRA